MKINQSVFLQYCYPAFELKLRSARGMSGYRSTHPLRKRHRQRCRAYCIAQVLKYDHIAKYCQVSLSITKYRQVLPSIAKYCIASGAW